MSGLAPSIVFGLSYFLKLNIKRAHQETRALKGQKQLRLLDVNELHRTLDTPMGQDSWAPSTKPSIKHRTTSDKKQMKIANNKKHSPQMSLLVNPCLDRPLPSSLSWTTAENFGKTRKKVNYS